MFVCYDPYSNGVSLTEVKMFTLINAKQFAERKLTEHGLTDWRFAFDDAKTRFGVCNFAKKKITVSLPLFHALKEDVREEKVKDTILHEIAHALAGNRAGHGRQWQAIAHRIGSRAERCGGDDLLDMSRVRSKYTATCRKCGEVSPMHRYSKHMYFKACGACCDQYNGGKYDERFLLNIKQNY